MPQFLGSHTYFLGTATGVTTISSAPCAVFGVLFQGSATNGIRIYNAPSTASATVASAMTHDVVAYPTAAATVNEAVYLPIPGMTDNGLTIDIFPSADPKLTLFYDPMGAST